jgi:polysaccharide biosynthesis protein PslH
VPSRILFLTHRLPYAPNRGDRLRAYHLIRTLAREFEVDVLSLVHDEEEASHASGMTEFCHAVHVARVPRLMNLARGAVYFPTGRPLTHVLLDSPDVRQHITRLMADRRPDLVFAFCSGMARFALEPPLAAIPCLLDMVDADSAKWADLSLVSSGPKRLVYTREAKGLARFEVKAMRHAYTTLVVNQRERDILHGLAPDARIEVMENGVDLAKFAPPPGPPPASGPANAPANAPVNAPTNATVVFCGVMNYVPNEQGALWLVKEVWPAVRAARPDARLVLVGASPTAAVQALAAPDITVTGTVDDVKPYLWNAAVAAAPLWTARGIQNKVLEAVAAGLPCVVVPPVAEGLPPEVTPACPVATSAAAFAEALLGLLAATPEARRELARQARIEALAWERRLAGLNGLAREAAAAAVTSRS